MLGDVTETLLVMGPSFEPIRVEISSQRQNAGPQEYRHSSVF